MTDPGLVGGVEQSPALSPQWQTEEIRATESELARLECSARQRYGVHDGCQLRAEEVKDAGIAHQRARLRIGCAEGPTGHEGRDGHQEDPHRCP